MTESTITETPAPVDVKQLIGSITQREWLLICRALEAPKDDVLEQTELLFPALCWVHRKHTHGGADMSSVLDLTDVELFAELGINTEVDEDEPEGKESPADTDPSPVTSPTSSTNGESAEPASVSPQDSPSPSTTS